VIYNKLLLDILINRWLISWSRSRCGRDPIVVGFTTTCASSAYQH